MADWGAIQRVRGYRHYLKEWRKYNALTQTDLAEKLGTSKGVVSRWETGERGIDIQTVFRIVHCLGIRPGQLFDPPPAQIGADGKPVPASVDGVVHRVRKRRDGDK